MTQPFRLNMARQIDSLIKSGPKLVWILNIAFILRIACSVLIQIVAIRRGTVCLFGDTPIYWEYAKSIANGTTYVVYQWDVPHYALRTPGYPAWLAGWIAIFGEWALPIRIGQSILSVCGILWLYKLAKVVGFSEQSARWSGTFLAFDPFQIVSTPLLLTESIFTPLLVLFVLVWVKALKSIQNLSLIKHNYFHYILLGVLQGVLTLIRPAWLPFIAILDLSFLWLISSQKQGLLVLSSLLLIQAGWALPIVPWMARNESVIGRASLVEPGVEPVFTTVFSLLRPDPATCHLWRIWSIAICRRLPRTISGSFYLIKQYRIIRTGLLGWQSKNKYVFGRPGPMIRPKCLSLSRRPVC